MKSELSAHVWARERSCKGTFILEMFLCVSNRDEIISEFKNGQHNLENMAIFIHDNKPVFNEIHGCPNTN